MLSVNDILLMPADSIPPLWNDVNPVVKVGIFKNNPDWAWIKLDDEKTLVVSSNYPCLNAEKPTGPSREELLKEIAFLRQQVERQETMIRNMNMEVLELHQKINDPDYIRLRVEEYHPMRRGADAFFLMMNAFHHANAIFEDITASFEQMPSMTPAIVGGF